jgi:hypothetical protein
VKISQVGRSQGISSALHKDSAESPLPTLQKMDLVDAPNLTHVLENDWFASLLLPYLPFGGLRNLAVSSKTARSAVYAFVMNWPEEIRELVTTWCAETPSSLLIAEVDNAVDTETGKYRHPAPIIRFRGDNLSYNTQSNKLLGQPWSEVQVNNQPPRALGRRKPLVCFTNDSKTQLFYCGGYCYVPGEVSSSWLKRSDILKKGTKAAGLLDMETGLWTTLPSMPEIRSCAGIFRVGSKVFVLCGGKTIGGVIQRPYKTTLCFDLSQMQWVDSGIAAFPGQAFINFAIVVISESTVIVAGGQRLFDFEDLHLIPSSQAFSLDINTGVWTQLPDLPGSVLYEELYEDCMGFCLTSMDHPQGIAVIKGWNNRWVSLMPNGEWVANSNLNGFGLKSLQLGINRNNVFSLGKWLQLPPHHNIRPPEWVIRTTTVHGESVMKRVPMLKEFGVQVGNMRLAWPYPVTSSMLS